tara:strand:+ start:55 stop:297 length:243 start_codon:yes stop_codon:yes gene_type:complete
MQEISNEVLRAILGVWFIVCMIAVARSEINLDNGFKMKHFLTIPFYGFVASFTLPILFVASIGILSLIYKLVMFIITGEF